ncbi:deaminase [Thalassovita sp.]|uniref:deaminase n=1 Tax=Thalassovita sp. TaxID=1979401 RepID=UPI0039B70079
MAFVPEKVAIIRAALLRYCFWKTRHGSSTGLGEALLICWRPSEHSYSNLYCRYKTSRNAISSTHAEIDALNQIQQRGIDVSGQNLTLYVDRTPCTACNQNGGIRSMVEQLGLNQLTVIGPDGPLVIRPR